MNELWYKVGISNLLVPTAYLFSLLCICFHFDQVHNLV